VEGAFAIPDFKWIEKHICHWILELWAGKIRRESDYWDAATFIRQVGLLPSQ